MSSSNNQAGSVQAGNDQASFQWEQVRLAKDRFPYFDFDFFGYDSTYPYLKHGTTNAGTDKEYYLAAPNGSTDPAVAQACSTATPTNLYLGDTFYVRDDDLTAASRSGWEYGALVVPFKMQLSDGSVSGSASLGPYLGFRIPVAETGVVMSPVAFVGASTITAPSSGGSSSSGNNTTQTLAGISYGGGLLFNVKSNFNVGIVLGFDHVNSSANYQYNGKPWLAFEIGYSFAQ